MVSYGSFSDRVLVMGLSDSVGHDDLDMRMLLLTNPWLSLSQVWVSTSIANATSILDVRVFVPLQRGVIVRAMMMFIHGVFLGMSSLFGMAAIIDRVLMQTYSMGRIWDPEITFEAFIVKIANELFDVRCITRWDYTSMKSNFLMRIMTPKRTNWYQIVDFSKLIPGATGSFYVMWSFKQRRPIRHTYHIRARWYMKKVQNMFNNMIVSKAYRMKASSSSFLHFCHLQYMAHNFVYVKNCFMKFCNGFVIDIVIPID
ncbi:predicted protein [Arabidopsis lyrata subsp. lyrata]|uniref:Predicted protein n=1 Tax=Arabidopsis lyrata subsp. lyrata TaxID=81972 RepID=D7KGL3_ARALL|nr:uncharacterized protein LOC9329743 [Arabidopsis lyrata subsp. lyrata]EFH67202.1 predicted protein [Arabidopsis lyrata subsp. lyrata]|eukprot:XP_002890943.1 uncharacterized protein LOC9329743 [Arabidopsis lyrata subsp. lyrata]